MARIALVSDRSATPAQFDSTGATNGQGLIYNAATGLWVPGSVGGTGAISSVFGRTGAITAQLGDYTAAQVTNAADKSSTSKQTFAGEVAPPDLAPAGLPGATAASRYVGATTFGAPSTGTFLKGDWIVDQSGNRWTCTTAGSPGTWTQEQGAGGGSVTSVFGRTGAVVSATGDYTAAQVTNAADKSSSSQQAFSGELRSPDLSLSGLTGATAAGRYVGSRVSGAPISGSFLQGDWVTDQAGIRWTCTAAGSPGTWTQEPGLPGPINVMAYGAVGDGITVDTTAVQNALNAASTLATSTGGAVTVVFPAGHKFLLGQVVPKNGVHVSAYGATIVPNLATIPSTGAGGLFGGMPGAGNILTGFHVYGGTWAGTGAETGNQKVFYTTSGAGVQDFLLRDLYVTNWGAGPTYVRNPTYARIIDCVAINCNWNTTGNVWSLVCDQSASWGGGILARGNYAINCRRAGIDLTVTGSGGNTYGGPLYALAEGNIVLYLVGGTLQCAAGGITNASTAVTGLSAGSMAVPAVGTVLATTDSAGLVPSGATLTITGATTGTLSVAATGTNVATDTLSLGNDGVVFTWPEIEPTLPVNPISDTLAIGNIVVVLAGTAHMANNGLMQANGGGGGSGLGAVHTCARFANNHIVGGANLPSVFGIMLKGQGAHGAGGTITSSTGGITSGATAVTGLATGSIPVPETNSVWPVADSAGAIPAGATLTITGATTGTLSVPATATTVGTDTLTLTGQDVAVNDNTILGVPVGNELGSNPHYVPPTAQSGNKFSVQTNQATATLNGTTGVVINTAEVRTGDRIIVQRTTRGTGSQGFLTYTINAGVSFTVTSSAAGDNDGITCKIDH